MQQIIVQEQLFLVVISYILTNQSGWDQVATSSGSSLWTQNGSNIYYNTGNVGIGTTNPIHKLTIKQDALNDPAGIRIEDANASPRINLIMPTSNSSALELYHSDDSLKIILNADPALDCYINSGKFGIGTISPQSALHVTGPVYPGGAPNKGIHLGADTSGDAYVRIAAAAAATASSSFFGFYL